MLFQNCDHFVTASMCEYIHYNGGHCSSTMNYVDGDSKATITKDVIHYSGQAGIVLYKHTSFMFSQHIRAWKMYLRHAGLSNAANVMKLIIFRWLRNLTDEIHLKQHMFSQW